ncbi:MAG: nuclear transport factor 2 family protein [Acidimicrobiales bacterium]
MSEAADLFRAGLERFGDGDLDGYLELLSDDVEVEFPFAPPAVPSGCADARTSAAISSRCSPASPTTRSPALSSTRPTSPGPSSPR